MDPLSGVASIIAVIQIAEDILNLFGSYILAVKDAKRDIERLSAEVLALRNILRNLQNLTQEPGSAKLSTLDLLNKPGGAMEKCLEELKELATRLDPGQGDAAMRRVGWRALRWPFSSKDVDKKILILERYKTAFNLTLTTDNTTLLLNMELEVTHINDGLTHVDEGVTRIDQGIMELRQAAMAVRTDAATAKELEIRNKIIGWLANTDPLLNHYAACKKHQAGTGKWFVEGPGMEKWKRQNSLLWLHGIPGCGKTVLSSTIIENINEFCIVNPGHAVAYYYFSFNDSEKQIAANFVSSVVAQLCTQVVDLPEELKGLYSRSNNGTRQAAMPDLKASLKLFAMMEGLQNVFMVIDALDECPRGGDREEILGLIAEMKTWSPSNLHLLITSRQEIDIEEKLMTLLTNPPISIQGSQVASDIELYVKDQIATVAKWEKLKVDLRLEIKDALMKGANGMFRWVFCQLEALKKCPPLQNPIRKALKNLPATLDETYERILGNIDDEDSQQIARRSLLWLAFSERPLYLEELAEAAVINTQLSDPERLPDPHYILELLGSLVTISLNGPSDDDDQDDSAESSSWGSSLENLLDDSEDVPGGIIIRLAHFSVKEYLVSDRIRSSKASIFGATDFDAHRFIAEICVLYILHYNQSRSKTISPKDLEIFPILKYACEFWYIHRNLILVESRKAIDDIAFNMFLSDNASLSWVQVHRPSRPWEKPFETAWKSGSPLLHASEFGIEMLVQLLIETKADVDAKDDDGDTALMRAADNGYEAIVQLLIEAKADIDAKDNNGRTALMRAANNGHKAIAQLLIEAKVDIDAKDDDGRTAIMRAAKFWHEAVVQLSIEAKADVDAKYNNGWTTLMRAAFNGHEAVVQLLIEAKVDIDAKDDKGQTALMVAANYGYKAIVQLLIEAKADVDAKDDKGRTALMRVIKSGHEVVVQLLIEAKASS